MKDSLYSQYSLNAVMTASPGELTLMLFNGAVRFIRQGLNFAEEKNIEGAHNAIIRAQEIIQHLNGTLNMDYEVSKNLAMLYDYIVRRLTEANIKKDGQILKEALDLVEDLRNTWAEALKLAGPASAAGL
ncbi:MAG: flagellar export chaperone FliS [Pelotomaculum sp.]|uniref:Flagellar secretion chaperone FliS n=1 Tax=Pelotomaculum thermopropionicum (strain DSM 13744 / JCM 10971 / SI) TaxID=370438 RepID=A5D0G3_PELTS|nr:flagellar export chaperone FliS [Pelotomaculum sp.]BAF60276.1 flagellin-specific chaperone FliS [Pelotomaculum thermopropionicum SI]